MQRAASGDLNEGSAVSIRPEVESLQPAMGVGCTRENRSPRPIPKQDARIAILIVDKPRQRFRSDDENMFEVAAGCGVLDELCRRSQCVDVSTAGCIEV